MDFLSLSKHTSDSGHTHQDNLEDAFANFLPSSSIGREERAIELIQNFATIDDD